MTKRYDIGGTGNRRKDVMALPVTRAITSETRLVSVETASQTLKDERGLDLSPWTICRRCSTGKWVEGIFWVKPMRHYLINLQAVYEAIASGEKI
jgi:hypothetical protein